jgi:glycosyltransferase involved in cell wall biosynthesis
VHFHGKASPEQVIDLLNGCAFVAIPSRVEPFGIVALEALAAGRPVLATRVGGMAEFLEQLLASRPGTGAPVTLVAPRVEALADGLRACLRAGPSSSEVEALRATVLRECSWSVVSRRYEEALVPRRLVPATSER